MKKTIRRTVISMAETKSAIYNINTLWGTILTAWKDTVLSPSQGGLSTQIIGRRFEVTGVKLRGILVGGQQNTVNDDPWNYIRCMVAVFDGDSATLTATQRWPQLNFGMTSPIRLRAPVEPMDGSTQYIRRILADKLWVVKAPAKNSTGYMSGTKAVHLSLRFKKPIIINYLNESSTIKPDKYLAIGMCSDSGTFEHPGFLSGSIEWTWKDL